MSKGKSMVSGSEVVAVSQVVEQGAGIHAERGDLGRVLEVLGDGWFMVRFDRTGAIAQCDESEISPR